MPAPWEVARDLRWAIVRGILLDPITWLGVAVASWALHSTGVAGSEAALLGLLAGAVLQADQLLFRSPDNDLLRCQPLGPHGLLQVRQAELGWWLHPVRLLAAAAAASDGGWWVGLAVWAVGGLASPV